MKYDDDDDDDDDRNNNNNNNNGDNKYVGNDVTNVFQSPVLYI